MSVLGNLWAGDYDPIERIKRIASNARRRLEPPHDCCGNYGEPGC